MKAANRTRKSTGSVKGMPKIYRLLHRTGRFGFAEYMSHRYTTGYIIAAPAGVNPNDNSEWNVDIDCDRFMTEALQWEGNYVAWDRGQIRTAVGLAERWAKQELEIDMQVRFWLIDWPKMRQIATWAADQSSRKRRR